MSPRPEVGALVRYRDPRQQDHRWGRVEGYVARGKDKGLAVVRPVAGGALVRVHPQALHAQGGAA